MQASQGLILLKETMLSDLRRRQTDFTNEVYRFRAKIVKETSEYVDERMQIDGKTLSERNEEQKSMNSALFHRTLQTSGLLEDSDGYYEHVCSSFPDVSWAFYVQSVVLCGWQTHARDCLSSLSKYSVVFDVAEIVIDNLKCLDCDNSVVLLRLVLSQVLSIVTDETVDRSIALVEKSLRLKCDESLERRKTEMLAILITQLCNVGTKRIEKILCIVLEATRDRAEFLNFTDTECVLGRCYFAVRHFVGEQSDRMDCEVVLTMKRWIEMVQTLNFTSSTNEEQIQFGIRAVYDGSSFKFTCELINKLIDHLVKKEHSGIIKCLMENCCKLNEYHVSRLLLIDLKNAESGIQAVISKAFSSWSWEVQDAFRGEHHDSCGVEDGPPLMERSLGDLTIVFNRISYGGDVDDASIKVISLACLRFPMETVHMLLQHAVKNGQSGGVVKILIRLRSTCNALVRSSNVSLLVISLRFFLVEEELGSKHWNNFLALIKELLKVDVLDLAEFARKGLFRYISPSPYCWRILSALKLVLECSSDAQLETVFESLDPFVWLRLVGQVLDDCMCRYTSFPFEDVIWDVLQLKSEATGVLNVANAIMQNTNGIQDSAASSWLREELGHLHPVIAFHLQDVLYRPTKLMESCFECRPLQLLLFVCCISKKNYDGVLAHLVAYETDLFPNGVGSGIATVFVKILSRLTASELQTVMELLVTFHSRSSEFSGSLHETLVTVIGHVTDACLMLFPCNSSVLTHPHMIRVVQNFTTALKTIIDTVESLPNESLLLIVSDIVRMIRCLCDACQTAPKLLILNLLRDIQVDSNEGSQSYDPVRAAAIDSIVGNVNDEVFVGRVKQLLGFR